MRAMPAPALFLDRDGVINVDHGYVHRVDQFDFMPGIFDLCRLARARQHRIVVITNQAGIGRGMYSEDDFHAITKWMSERFEQEGAAIDAVYFCPSHPTEGVGRYRVESSDRKPGPGMILRAAAELNLDLAQSVLIGDKPSDVLAGEAAGVGRLMLLRATGTTPSPRDVPERCIEVADLSSAAQALITAPAAPTRRWHSAAPRRRVPPA